MNLETRRRLKSLYIDAVYSHLEFSLMYSEEDERSSTSYELYYRTKRLFINMVAIMEGWDDGKAFDFVCALEDEHDAEIKAEEEE